MLSLKFRSAILGGGDYPTYEGGLSEYDIAAVSEQYLPISGIIRNNITGEEIKLSPLHTRRSSKITAPGHYKAELTTRPDDKPGDYRVFTFEFDIIPYGNAPGPVIKMKLILDITILSSSRTSINVIQQALLSQT